MKQQQSTQVPEQAQADHRSLSNEQLKSQGGTRISGSYHSPLRLLIVTIVAIFIAEVVAMIVVYALDPLPYYQTTLIDAGIMTILIFPVLYYLSFRPLLQQIEKSRQAEDRLRRVNRTLFVLNECNQALVHAEKESEFLQRMCEILVNIGEYRMAWIGFAEYDESRSVRPAAQFGFENGYLDLAHITWADDERGQGPTGTAIRQEAVQVNQNFLTNPKMTPWRETALQRGYQSSIALPLQDESSTIGALTIYSALPDAFDKEEVHLLKELANDLAFGITALRVRSERNQAEELNRQLSRIVEQTEDTVVVTNCKGAIEYVNPAFERLTGYTKEETLGKTPRVLKSGIHNSDFYEELWNTILKGTVFQSELANRKKNGELFYEVKTITPLRDVQGDITHFVATGKDITQHKLDEARLLKAYDELELRVQERTEELRIANSDLEDEINVRRMAEGALQKVNEELQIQAVELEAQAAELKEQREKLALANERLRVSQERLNRAQEIAHLGSWELDLINNRLTWSDEVYRIFGLQPQEFQATYEAFLEAVHPDDRVAVDLAYSNSVRDAKDGYEIEHRVIKQSTGEIRIVHEKCEHFRDKNGQIISSVGMVHDITERKQAEKRLAYLASFPKRNPNPLIEVDFNGQVYYANDAALSILPDLAELGLAHPWLDGLNELVSAFRECQPINNSREVVLGERFYQQSFHVLAEDRLVRIYGTDITKRKRAEEALRESETKYRNLFENMTEEVHFWRLVRDEAGQIITWRLVDANPPTLKSWNRGTVDEIREKTTDEIFGPGATDHYMPIVQKIMSEGIPYSYEDKFAQLDKYFRFTSVPLGEYFITTGADITQIKTSEEALRAARDQLELRVQERTRELANANRDLLNEIAERKEVERQLRIQTTAMEAAGNGIVITDRHGVIQWTNPAMTRISGYDGRDLIGQSMHVFSSGQHDTDYYRQLWNTILSGQVWRGETINRRKDGTIYTEEQTITPVQSDHGVITHFIAIKQDITERKQAEIELERRNTELQTLSATEHKQRQLAETLRASALALAETLDLDVVLRTLLKHVRSLVQSDTASVILLEGESLMVVRAVEGFEKWIDANQLLPYTLEGEDNILYKKILSTQRSLLIANTAEDSDWKVLPGTEQLHNWIFTPIVVEGKIIGVVGLGKIEVNYFTEEHIQWTEALAGHAAVAIQNAWLFEQVRASTERLHLLSRRLVEIQETERHYISRELHDEAGQILTSLMVDLRLLEKNVSDPSALLKIIAEMEESLDAVSENLHRVAMALRPASLDHVGLVAALRQYTESLSEKNGLQVSFRAGDAMERLPSNVETVLYRIIQEALTNVLRHAHATRADVVLTIRDEKLIVIIEDDGVGFDPDFVSKGERLGLFGMRERAEMIGGKLTIESMPGQGTTVIMEVNYADTVIGRR